MRYDKPKEHPERWAIIPHCEYLRASQTLLDVSNYRILKKELLEFNDAENTYVQVGEMNHWLVGPIEQMFILCLRDDGHTTEAYDKLLELLRKLDGYPVLDEEHYDKLQTEQEIDCIRRCLEDKGVDSHLIEEVACEAHAWIEENREDELDRHRSDDMGYVSEECVEAYLEHKDTKG